MTIWNDCRTLVAAGEAETALELIQSFLKGQLPGKDAKRARQLLSEAISLRASDQRLRKKVRQRALTADEEEVGRVRRDLACLDLINEGEHMTEQPSPLGTAIFDGEPKIEKLMASESHLRSTGWLAEGLRIASAVCRLSNGRMFGSGFRCRNDAVLTNHHVIESADSARSFHADFFFEENAQGDLGKPYTIKLNPKEVFWTSAKFDVTLVGLAEVPRDEIATITLEPGVRADIDDHVSIIQHPNGGPKQIAITNNRIINFFDFRVQYLTDTLPGSSGSPVLNDSWQALAIHHAGGDMKRDKFGNLIFANEGILTSALFSDPTFAAAYHNDATFKRTA